MFGMQKVEEGRTEVQHHSQVNSKFEMYLGYMTFISQNCSEVKCEFSFHFEY